MRFWTTDTVKKQFFLGGGGGFVFFLLLFFFWHAVILPMNTAKHAKIVSANTFLKQQNDR